ncbi:uncharacterized protein At3g27210-like [Tasmannia lanceolata]|uniref:uncharacterized protein At3g27210-like n=1 Tax=Tasmannia lanceolata TaxID=3420 RepID=UPI004064625E
MGSCVSVHRNPNSAMKFQFSMGSKAKKLFVPSPTMENVMNGTNGIGDLGLNSSSSPPQTRSSRYFGSKEETFFDTQVWLESDCEDDFLSVNGDFTSSSCSTPNHQRSTPGTPQLKKAFFVDRTLDPTSEFSPTDKKKKLADLFRESLGDEQVPEEQNLGHNQSKVNGKLDVNNTNIHTPPKSSQGTPYLSVANSVCNSERIPNKDTKHEKEKTVKATQCCMPGLI